MHLLGLLRGSDLAGANGPDRLVGNDDLRPVLDGLGNSLHLTFANLNGLASLSFFKELTDAKNYSESVVQSIFGLDGHSLISFLDFRKVATLRVSEDDPLAADIFEHLRGNFTGVRTLATHPGILSSDGEVLAQVLASVVEVWGRRSAHNLDIRSDRSSLVEALNESLDAFPVAVALPVAPDEELADSSVGDDVIPHRRASSEVRSGDEGTTHSRSIKRSTDVRGSGLHTGSEE
mmetsp:Transcript_22539/g.45270  ORF Transcript_22539/g.45270 Transcript_22539/m.45270 type:complete len:234 (-) Transcript_22539:152-853(-)